MNRDLGRLSDGEFDLLVIGGGIHGLCAAYDAALRGLSVALVERDDFGGASSFNRGASISVRPIANPPAATSQASPQSE